MKSAEAHKRQVHVRVSPEIKKAMKILCARDGMTEQDWVHQLIEHDLQRKAPELLRQDFKEALSGRKGA